MVGMNPKKIHETSRLTPFITQKAQEHSISSIVDLGAGQGYLSHLLITRSGLQVTAIEGRELNAHRSQQRADKISKCLHTPKLHTICKIVTSEDLKTLITEPSLLIGLHTCGDLAANSIKMFIQCEVVRGLINVGCCYHHLTEYVSDDSDVDEYLKEIGFSKDGRSLDESLVRDPDIAGFPLSQFIRRSYPKFFLGKLLRSLCIGDSRDNNLAVKKALRNFVKLEYRAAFQVFLTEYFPDYAKVFALGNKMRKFEDFGDYCLVALKLMKLQTDLTKEELNKYYEDRFESNAKKISILWVLRSVFSGPIENLILLDRLLYLEECGIQPEAISVFDRNISPRNVVIAAFKK